MFNFQLCKTCLSPSNVEIEVNTTKYKWKSFTIASKNEILMHKTQYKKNEKFQFKNEEKLLISGKRKFLHLKKIKGSAKL